MAFGKRDTTPSFVLTLPLDISTNEKTQLDKEFRKCWTAYNQLVDKTTNMWRQLRKTKKYRKLITAIEASTPDSEERLTLYKQREKMLREAGFSEGNFHSMISPCAKHLSIDSHVAQMIASDVWKAWKMFFFKNGKTVHYKKIDEMLSISGKTNECGIMFRPAVRTTSNIESLKRDAVRKEENIIREQKYKKPDGTVDKIVSLSEEDKKLAEEKAKPAIKKIQPIAGKGNRRIVYRGWQYRVKTRNENTPTGQYQKEALEHGVKYCRIIRKWVKDQWKYYAQLVLEGEPPVKRNKDGMPKNPVKDGVIGADMGAQTVALSGNDFCTLRVLAESARARANGLVAEIARTERAMDRSRRASNPEYFNPDGTIKRLPRINGKRQVRKWKYSNNYCKLRAKLRDLNRKLADMRKVEHNILANEILSHGNIIIVEDMNYKALQKRAKETKINPKTGRAYSKKRFGKSLSRCAPAMFLSILTQKAKRHGGDVIKVSTFDTKASQYDHTDQSYTKKELSERMAHLSSGEVVQRDMYSAFLLAHINLDTMEYDNEALKAAFPAFLEMHENTKHDLLGHEGGLPASIGF